ncbi:MAG: hypothetical protein AABW54_00345 [Candidatus Micrarchaeota archaeon]
MARIMLIANEHPNEAFAIRVAKEVERHLKNAGHDVKFHKFPYAKTPLGQAVKRRTVVLLDNAVNEKDFPALKNFDFAYNFHCTPHDCGFWERNACNWKMIQTAKAGKPVLVETKAAYELMPPRFLRTQIEPIGIRNYDEDGRYFLVTTSQKQSRALGLTPEAFGEAIAKSILAHVKENERLPKEQKRREHFAQGKI